MSSLLIVDDHTVVREGLGRVLGSEFPGCVIGYAATAQEALATLDEGSWRLAILDISLPGGDGLELIRSVRDRSASTRILVHTMHPEDQFAVRSLRAGADGYITKDASVNEIIFAVRKILHGGRYVSSSLAEILAGAMATHADRGIASLSDREFQVLRSITQGKTPHRYRRRTGLKHQNRQHVPGANPGKTGASNYSGSHSLWPGTSPGRHPTHVGLIRHTVPYFLCTKTANLP